MSLRLDSTEWISGALLIGETGLGVLGSAIPSTGDSGGSYLYNDLSLPADANKEICGRITTWPASGTLVAYEDGSFSFTGAADGAYSFAYQLYVDGVATGAPTSVALAVGAAAHQVTIASSTQANTSTTAAIQQTHLVSIADSVQANVGSPGAATQAVPGEVTVADSVQSNTGTAGSIQQTHLITIANSVQANRGTAGSWGGGAIGVPAGSVTFALDAQAYTFIEDANAYSFAPSTNNFTFGPTS